MLLPVPIVGVDPGPDYALNVNNCFFFLDAHDHSPGKGLQITPSGLNINAALTFTNNPATNLSFINFNSQGSVSTLKSLYVINNDLYFTDGNGNAFPLTASGGVAGTPGSIGSLIAPASVTYNSGTQTFIFAATATQAANIDGATFILRNTTAPFNGITLSAPLALASSYNIVLPPLPASGLTSFVVMDASGNMSAPWRPDYSTINVDGSNQLFANIVQGEHSWELNGYYGILAYPQTNIDSVFFAPYNLAISSILIYTRVTGSSGITEYDLKVKATPSSAWTSILSVGGTGKIAATTNLTSLTNSAGTATATLANHGFIAGEIVTISGAATTQTVTSITSAAGVATVNFTSHGYTAGNYVTVSGATPSQYNGTYLVTGVPNANQFTYNVSANLTSPATGTITVTGFNGIFTIINVPNSNQFTYAVPTSLPTSATGTPAVATRSEAYTDSGSVIGPQAGITKPIISTFAIPAGALLRWDLLQSMSASAQDARIRIYYTKT